MSERDRCSEPRFRAFLAIDWGDQKHFFTLEDAHTGERERGSIEHQPAVLARWITSLLGRFDGPIAVALEQSRGSLLAALLPYDGLVIYPIHPALAARLRQAFVPSGAKDDLPDAELLLDVLTRHRDRLRRLLPDTSATRTLQLLVEERRKLVDEKTRHKNRLTDKLKLYYPQVLAWFRPIDTPLVEAFLQRWPTLEAVQRARPATVLRFFEQHHSRFAVRNQQRLASIRESVPLTRDPAVIAAATAAVPVLLQLIRTLREGISRLEKQIAQIVADHPDYALFAGLPGAGVSLAPRLLAAFGTRRDRFRCAAELQTYSGIAPVLERSGKRQRVRFRRAGPRFVRQSFQEFAGCSVFFSVWARAFYEQKRSRGLSHHQAVRALAYKWIRILFRCWQTRTPYNEARYLETLARRGSPFTAHKAIAVKNPCVS